MQLGYDDDDSMSRLIFAVVIAGIIRPYMRGNANRRNREVAICLERWGIRDGEPKTLVHVAREFGVNKETVRQIEHAGTRALQANSEKLLPYYEMFCAEDAS